MLIYSMRKTKTAQNKLKLTQIIFSQITNQKVLLKKMNLRLQILNTLQFYMTKSGMLEEN